ncbi:BtrH N-terminal domain-containing protein [Symbiobacterium terraclitae]|uniref:BtrH N-terminal domain-containing protein n=1 Tax=Symbiobacterium terraclitae TaxID=557451 RepID=UPI0035B553F0
MRRMLPFDHHQLGLNCGSAPIRDVLEYYGLKFTESMCFGLGSGLVFVYHHSDPETCPDPAYWAPYWSVTGRGWQPYADLAHLLDIRLIVKRGQTAEDSWDEIRRLIDAGVPVIVDCDRKPLVPYFNQTWDLPPCVASYNFGGHKTIVVGYDDERATVAVVENMLPGVWEVPFEAFQASRSSAEFYPSENEWMYIEPLEPTVPLKDAIPFAIRKVVNRYHSRFWNGAIGLSGLRRFCEEFPHWPELLPPTKFQATVFMTDLQCNLLSGGGHHRKMYSRFLMECADLLGDERYVSLARHYAGLARTWNELNSLMLEGARAGEPRAVFEGERAKGLLQSILDGEAEAAERLEALLA